MLLLIAANDTTGSIENTVGGLPYRSGRNRRHLVATYRRSYCFPVIGIGRRYYPEYWHHDGAHVLGYQILRIEWNSQQVSVVVVALPVVHADGV